MTDKEFSQKFIEAFNNLPQPKERVITLYTGVRGMGHWDWALADKLGMIPKSETRTTKFIYQIPNTREAVDTNREIWMWGFSSGKLVWKRVCALAHIDPRPDAKQSRYNLWEKKITCHL